MGYVQHLFTVLVQLTQQLILVPPPSQLEASIHLARLSPSLIILAVRNTSSGQRAKQTIMSSVPEYMGSIEVWELDLSSFDSVKTFAKRAERELKRLDALLENAGVVNINWTETVDKYEQG